MPYILQAPFNPKDWQFALPVSVFAVIALLLVGVWCAKQLGLARSPELNTNKPNGGSAMRVKSGDLDPADWTMRIQAAAGAAVKAEIGIQVTLMLEAIKRIEEKQDEIVTAVNALANAIARSKGFGD